MNKNRWLILAACVLINLALGAGYAWSVFQGPLMEQFGWTSPEASLAFSISFAMVPIGMMVFGPVQDKHGPKWITFLGGLLFGLGMIMTSFVNSLPMLYLSYGVILGFGIGAAYGCTTATTVKWFPDKKGLAGGLTAAGFGSGALVFAPLARTLITNTGVLNTFRILGIALLVVICLASLLLSAPEKKASAQLSENDKKASYMVKQPTFWMLWLVYIFGCVSGLMMIGHASMIAQEHLAFDLTTATTIVMVVSLANTFGRIGWGTVSDKIGRYLTVALMFISSAIGLLLLYININSILGVVGIILIAASFGVFLGNFPGITAENWGSAFNGTNYGVMFTAYGVASVVGPMMAASLKESSGGSYNMAFMIALIMSIVGFVMIMMLKKNKRTV